MTGLRHNRMLKGPQHEGVNISRPTPHWPPPMSSQEFSPYVYVLKKVDGSRRVGCCGGLRLCNRSSSTMWLHGCASTLRGKIEWHKAPELKHATWCLVLLLPLHLSPTTIIKLLSPGGAGLSYRQPESGGSPISFVHFATSFSAEPILPPGWVRPVPV